MPPCPQSNLSIYKWGLCVLEDAELGFATRSPAYSSCTPSLCSWLDAAALCWVVIKEEKEKVKKGHPEFL